MREDQRADLASISRILIDAPHGARIPLEDVATLAVRGGSMNIAHESGKRLASIGVFLRDRDMGSAVAEMQRLAWRV